MYEIVIRCEELEENDEVLAALERAQDQGYLDFPFEVHSRYICDDDDKK